MPIVFLNLFSLSDHQPFPEARFKETSIFFASIAIFKNKRTIKSEMICAHEF